MPDVVDAPSITEREFARELVEALTRLAVELALESGPYNSRPPALSDAATALYQEFVFKLNALKRTPDARIASTFSDLLGRFVDEVVAPVLKANHDTSSNAIVLHREALEACVRFRDSLSERFGIRISQRAVRGELTGSAAIVAVDLVAYEQQIAAARRTESGSGTGSIDALERLDSRIREQIENAIGPPIPQRSPTVHVLRFEGDGAILRFDTATEAAAFATRLHREAESYSTEAKLQRPFQYRVGIAFGTIRARLSESFSEHLGLPFVVAARLKRACPPGGIAIESGAWDRMVQIESVVVGIDEDPFLSAFAEQTVEATDGQTYRCWVHPGSSRDKRKRGNR